VAPGGRKKDEGYLGGRREAWRARGAAWRWHGAAARGRAAPIPLLAAAHTERRVVCAAREGRAHLGVHLGVDLERRAVVGDECADAPRREESRRGESGRRQAPEGRPNAVRPALPATLRAPWGAPREQRGGDAARLAGG